jgi:hypothetical protein
MQSYRIYHIESILRGKIMYLHVKHLTYRYQNHCTGSDEKFKIRPSCIDSVFRILLGSEDQEKHQTRQ